MVLQKEIANDMERLDRTYKSTETVIPNETWDGIQIYCKVKDSSGNTANSNIAIVVVND